MKRAWNPNWYNSAVMNPNEDTSTQEKNLHPMVVMQPGERVICELKRHPIGILTMYFGAFIAVAVLTALLYVMMPSLKDAYGDEATTMVALGGGILLIGLVLMLFISTIIYWQNQWVVTTDSITQITQNGLFGRHVSQLSMENLEDVTVNQDGILPHMFNYGTLKVESAGERSKFQFPYCPNPNQCAREILDTHEKFLEERRNIRFAGSGINVNTNQR
jgi:uncharacterized membrane protein YdbT with pleckstrin-like domain